MAFYHVSTFILQLQLLSELADLFLLPICNILPWKHRFPTFFPLLRGVNTFRISADAMLEDIEHVFPHAIQRRTGVSALRGLDLPRTGSSGDNSH